VGAPIIYPTHTRFSVLLIHRVPLLKRVTVLQCHSSPALSPLHVDLGSKVKCLTQGPVCVFVCRVCFPSLLLPGRAPMRGGRGMGVPEGKSAATERE